MHVENRAIADAARIKTLEEELALAHERARSEGDQLEMLRREVCGHGNCFWRAAARSAALKFMSNSGSCFRRRSTLAMTGASASIPESWPRGDPGPDTGLESGPL